MRLSLPSLSTIGALAVLAIAATVPPAGAADLDGYYGGPPRPPAFEVERRPPPPPIFEAEHRPPPLVEVAPPRFEGPPPRFAEGPPPPPPCRVILRRGFDPDGDEVLRRVRICDGPAAYAAFRGPPPPDGFPWRHRPWWRD